MISKNLIGALSFLYCGSAYAAGGSAEALVGNNATSLDTKFFGELAPHGGFFTRNITTVAYDGTVNPFTIVDLNRDFSKEVAGVVEAQFSPASGFVLRGGLQYVHAFGDFHVFLLSTVGVQDSPTLEMVGSFSYTFPLGKTFALEPRLEAVTNVGGTGHNFSVERGRFGLRSGDYSGGLAANMLQVGPVLESSSNLGLFVAKKF